ncbi:MAG: hypothetical protein KBS59_03515 [Clostridiales bacterium]|nr:hypothetical protein [Clostridiales bacterium]
MMCDGDALEYSAYVSAFLSYYKIEDDVKDSRGIKRFINRAALFFAKIPLKKIPASYAPLGAKIRDSLEMLTSFEKQYCAEPSAVADCFGEIIGYALAFGLDEEKTRIAYEIGKSVGRWVYLADAAVDFDSDIKSGSYNPYIYALEKFEVKQFFSERLDGILSMELVRANAAAELLDDGSDCFGCVKNIITEGMRKSLSDSLEKASGRKTKHQ